MASTAPEIIFGAGGIYQWSFEQTEEILKLLQERNVKSIDTAYVYQESESIIGKHGAGSKFAIHTKAPALSPGAMTKQGIIDGMEKSLKELGVPSVSLYYLHAPEPSAPIEETLSGIQELYAAGKFERFGISNYPAADVQKIYDLQKAAGSVPPTVYQGNYNAFARHSEAELVPLLRRLGICYYAYSPIAGGFLARSAQQIREKTGGGRMDPGTVVGSMYNTLYGGKSLVDALQVWEEIATDAGIPKAALAYRWVTYHGALKEHDGVIMGFNSLSQAQGTLDAIAAGPLEDGIVKRVDAIWESIKDEAPFDNWNDYFLKGLHLG